MGTSIEGGGSATTLDGEWRVAPERREEELRFDRKSRNPGLVGVV